MKSRIKRRRLGRTELFVSELSYGAMNLRLLDTIDEAYEILDYVLSQGVNLIDTARAYNGINGHGEFVESEVLVGNAIRRRSDLDEPIVVVTKGHGYTPSQFDEDLSVSLSKLKVEGRGNLTIGKNPIYLVYLYHGLNKERWETIVSSGSLERALEVKAQGIVNFIGFSSHYKNAPEIKDALDTDVFDVVELPYNIFNATLGEDGEINLLKYAYERNVGIINMKAFGGNSMPDMYNVLQEYIDIDYRAMLNFCLSNPYISTVDAGARYVNEFSLDIDTATSPRPPRAELARLKNEASKIADCLQGLCRECLHCIEKFECPEGVDFPAVLSVYSRYLLSVRLGRDTEEFRDKYEKQRENAEKCIGCGKCLSWCEYKLDIPAMLKDARDALR
ncbi:MAG: aldo/keto reductase [Bacillota bacterium]|nr:aldo/keto reductase [Bacillota bacterium]